MQIKTPSIRAAQYVRMSTDEQQYSTINQKNAIALWAEERGIEIVATYEDAGKSGLTLAGRPALRQLIADALAGPELFEAILVYDVSRWGRFQDADESAHLEYLCRSAGVTVHYCAEQFTNDGSTMSNLYKVMKRTLAAEYSRELSEKVKIGKARLASFGFRQGGLPGFGFRRRLLDQHGADKGLLAPGEHKRLTTDRVILVLGPSEELATVRWIYQAYTARSMTMADICKKLNARGIENAGKEWTKRTVSIVLTSPKYAGDNT
jgi:DNA invertase Pin-like site-specific DNA recombinase